MVEEPHQGLLEAMSCWLYLPHCLPWPEGGHTTARTVEDPSFDCLSYVRQLQGGVR